MAVNGQGYWVVFAKDVYGGVTYFRETIADILI